MTEKRPYLSTAADPLAQVFVDLPAGPSQDEVIALSQCAALTHWPTIEAHPGTVSIVLRRPGSETEVEWRDHLALLQSLITQSGRSVQFLALNENAASELSTETGETVRSLPALPRAFQGSRTLKLTRTNGALEAILDPSKTLPAQRLNLGRLRRVALLGADDIDRDLSDIAHFTNGTLDTAPPRPSRSPVIVVVVPNGFGLGHVTRMLAVAQHIRDNQDARVVFWSFSRAAGIIARFGFEVIARHTSRHTGADTDAWRKWETAEFATLLASLRPDLVVQDAAALDDFVVDALAKQDVGSARIALVRRGMWQKHILGATAFASEDLADLVVEPGDLAAAADRGLTRGRAGKANSLARMDASAPVTLTHPKQMLDQRRARKALGLGRGRHCLITLGGDAFSDMSHLVRHIIDSATKARVRLVWARSPLAAPDHDIASNTQIISRSLYPLAPYLAAFDGVVSSSGYNSFHELMQLCDRPVLFAPRQHSALDDQMARAAHAASQGWAMHADASVNEAATINAFMNEVRAGKTVTTRPKWRNGAAQMADLLMDLIEIGGPSR